MDEKGGRGGRTFFPYEALSAGAVPVVARACEGGVLADRFGAGRSFEPLDDEELARAVKELADDPAGLQEVRRTCLTMAKRFDRGVIAERTEAILQAVAARKPLPEVTW